MNEVSDTDDNFDHHIGLSPHSSDDEIHIQSVPDAANKNVSLTAALADDKSKDDDIDMTAQMCQLSGLVGEMKEGFLTAMQALAQIQHGDQVLQEKVDKNKAQYENQLADVLKMVVNLKSEFSGVLTQLQTASSNQRSLQKQVETLQYERDVLLQELEKAGSISSQVREKYHTGSKQTSSLSHSTSLTALLEKGHHTSPIRPNGSSNSIHITSDHDSGVNSAVQGDSCDDSPTTVSPLVQSYIANLSQSQTPAVPEEDGNYESDCSLAAAANHSLDLSRSLIDELDDFVGSGNEKETEGDTESVQQSTQVEESTELNFKTVETPKKLAPHERSAKDYNRLRIARELLDTEKKYCSCLWTLLDHFAGQIKEKAILSVSDISEMFPPCLANMYDHHCALLLALEQRLTNCKYQYVLGDILCKFIQDSQCELLCLYQTYMREFPRSMQTIKEVAQSNVQFRKFLKDAQKDPCCEGLDVSAFLLTPVQRIPRYVLLFKQMLRSTEVDHPDHYYIQTSLRHLGSFLNILNDSIQQSLHHVNHQKNKTKRRFSILQNFRHNSAGSVNSIRPEATHQNNYLNQRLGINISSAPIRPSAETIYGRGNYGQYSLPHNYSTESFLMSDEISMVQDSTGRLVPTKQKKHKGRRKKECKQGGNNSLTHSASFHSSQSESNFGTEMSYPISRPAYMHSYSVTEDISESNYYGAPHQDPRVMSINKQSRYIVDNKRPGYPKPPPEFANETSTPNLYALKSQSAVHFGIYGENDSDVDADISSSTNPASIHSPRYRRGRALKNPHYGLKSQSCVDVTEQSENSLQERINVALARSLTFKDSNDNPQGEGNVQESEYEPSWNNSFTDFKHPQKDFRLNTLSGSETSEQDWTFQQNIGDSPNMSKSSAFGNQFHQNMVQGVSRKEGKKKRTKQLQTQSEADLLDQSTRKKKSSIKQSLKNMFFRKRVDSDISDDVLVNNPVSKESTKVIIMNPALNRPKQHKPKNEIHQQYETNHLTQSSLSFNGDFTTVNCSDSQGDIMTSPVKNRDHRTVIRDSMLMQPEMSQIEEQTENVILYGEDSGEPCSAV